MSSYAIISFKEDVYTVETILNIDEIEKDFIKEPLKDNWTVWALLENTTEVDADKFASSLKKEGKKQEEAVVYGHTYVQSNYSGWKEVI